MARTYSFLVTAASSWFEGLRPARAPRSHPPGLSGVLAQAPSFSGGLRPPAPAPRSHIPRLSGVLAQAPVALLLVGCNCGAPLEPTDAGRDGAADARAGDAFVPTDAPATCPTDLEAAAGTDCTSAGLVCISSACEISGCHPECIEILCDAMWMRRRTGSCVDGGPPDGGLPDGGLPDGGPPDGGPPGCTGLAMDRATSIADLTTSGAATSIVWDGSRYAIAWFAHVAGTTRFATHIALADAEGNVIAGSAHPHFPADDRSRRGAVLAVGDGELGMAYIEGAALTETRRVHFARLDLDGNVVPGSPIQLSAERGPHHAAAIAWSSTLRQWAVAWQGTEPLDGGVGEHHVYLTLLDADGRIVGSSAGPLDELVSTTSPGEGPSLVWTGDRFAIVLDESRSDSSARVVIAEIDPARLVVSRRIVLHEGGRPFRAALATDGTTYGAAWMMIESANPLRNGMLFRRAAVDGDALGTVLPLSGDRGAGEPSVVFSGETFRVAFYEGNRTSGGVWLARIGRDGTVIGTPGEGFAGAPPYSAFPLIATDGCNDGIAWTRIRATTPQTAEIRMHMFAESAR